MNTHNPREDWNPVMTFGDFTTIRPSLDGGVLTVVLDNPPVNVLGATMMREVRDLLTDVQDNSSVKVIVFESANPEFFLAHVDMRIADDMEILTEVAESAPPGVNVFQSIGELIRHQPQVTIVKLRGVARGGGAEFVAAADMSSWASLPAGARRSTCASALAATVPSKSC
jgi:enoyl-CoA hydratase/carnithine racemase